MCKLLFSDIKSEKHIIAFKSPLKLIIILGVLGKNNIPYNRYK